MNVTDFIRRSQQVLKDNSPVILTGAGIAGTIFTAFLSGRAGYKAGYRVALDEATGGTKSETTKDRRIRIAKMTWIMYLPATASGAATVAAIAGANHIGTKRTTALAAAYTLTDKAFMEYKDKVAEKLGEKKETEIRDAVAKDKVNSTPIPTNSLVFVDEGDVWCFDTYSGRYFKSNMEAIKRAVNDTNYEITHQFSVSLTEFYDKLGLAKTAFSDDVGWNSDALLDVHYSTVLSEAGPGIPEGKPCIAIGFHVEPHRMYYRVHGGS